MLIRAFLWGNDLKAFLLLKSAIFAFPHECHKKPTTATTTWNSKQKLKSAIFCFFSHSFWWKSFTNVDFPTRRAPSTRMAVFPFLVFFHCRSLSYSFRLKILSILFSNIYDSFNFLVLCLLAVQKYKNLRKYANLFGGNLRKYANLFSRNIRKYANLL